MKLTKLALSLAVLTTVGSFGYMNAVADEDDNLCAAITAELSVSGSNVCVSIQDGVATLSGYVETETERQEAERIAMAREGVTKVINLLTTK